MNQVRIKNNVCVIHVLKFLYFFLFTVIQPSTSRASSEPIKKKIMTPMLAAVLDRVGMSDRNAMFVVSTVLTSAGLNLGECIYLFHIILLCCNCSDTV